MLFKKFKTKLKFYLKQFFEMTEEEISNHSEWIQDLKEENENFYSSTQKTKTISKNFSQLSKDHNQRFAKNLIDQFESIENLSETTSKTDYKLELIYNELDSEFDLLQK